MDQFEEIIKRLTIPVTISLMAGFARFFISEEKSFWNFIRCIALAAFFGYMTTLGLQDMAFSEGTKGMITGVTSFCGAELGKLLIAAAVELRKDPIGYAAKIIEGFRRK